MEQNKTAIANLETVCKSSSNDTAYIELHTLRKEYELTCSENAILREENAEYLERMNNLGPVYTYPDSFVSANILLRIQNFTRPHVSEFVAFSSVHTYPRKRYKYAIIA